MRLSRAGLAALLVALAACTDTSPFPSTAPSESGATVDQILRLAYAEVPTLDPHLTVDTSVSLLVRGLTWFDEGLLTVPGLAESWDVTDGGRHVRFHLREASYSSGEPIVAQDFVHGWRRSLDPRIGGHYGFLLADVAGAAELLALDPEAPPPDEEIDALLEGLGVSAPDERTLDVALARPAVYFATVAANPGLAPIPEAWITRPGATEAGAYWSSGPFVLTEWVHDQRRTLEPNPMWWGEPVGLERIDMRAFASEEDAIAAFQEGTIDILDLGAPPSDPELAAASVEKPSASFWHIVFDMHQADGPAVRSQAMREALGLAVDREALNEAVGFTGPVATSPIPPGVPGHDPDLASVFDPDEARARLNAALDELGLRGPDELSLTFLHGTLVGDGPRYLEQQWREVLGLEVAFTGLEPPQYLELLGSGAHGYDMFWIAWFADYPHPQSFLEPLWACESFTNPSGYCNPDVDELFAQAAGTADESAQLELYAEAQRAMTDDEVSVFLQWPSTRALVSPHVNGLEITPFDSYYGLMFPEQIRIVAD